MNKNEIEQKINKLVSNFLRCVELFKEKYSKGREPSRYFYEVVIRKLKNGNLEKLLDEENYLQLLYATLVSWDMNSRGARMIYFDNFKDNIQNNKSLIFSLSEYKIHLLDENEFDSIIDRIGDLFSKLEIMKSSLKLVSNSKLMHFLLPDLIMPIDGAHTLNFFYNNTNQYNPERKFAEIIKYCFKISKNYCGKIDFENYLDSSWNASIPKIIDNAIIGFVYGENKRIINNDELK